VARSLPPAPSLSVRLGAGIALAVVTVGVYAQIAGHSFVEFDDSLYITENPVVQRGLDWDSFRWAWFSADAYIWHPLTWLSYLLDADLYGTEDAGPWLLTNLAWHIAATWALLGALFAATGRFGPSLCVAALFAVHPIQVESVAWASARKEVLAGFLAFTTIWAWVGYARKPSRRRLVWTALLFAACLSAKGSHVALPVGLLLLDFWPLGRLQLNSVVDWRRRIAEKLPLLGLSLGAVWVQYALVSGITGPWAEDAPLLLRAMDGVMAYAATLQRLFWPDALAIVYPTPSQMGLAPVSWLRVFAVIAVGAAATWGALRCAPRHGYLIVGWLWFLALLFPMVGLIPSGLRVMHDRYVYVPIVGIALVLTFAGDAWAQRHRRLRPALVATAVAGLGACVLLSFAQVRVWRDSLALFDHTLAVTERNAIVHVFNGNTLAARGNFRAAQPHFEAALAIRPRLPQANHALGLLYLETRRPVLAQAPLRAALAERPGWTRARVDLGRALWSSGDRAAAIEQLEAALRAEPDSEAARYWLERARRSGAPTSRTRSSSVSGSKGLRRKPDRFRRATSSVARSSE
jgi:hypothetical protein